MNGSVLAQKIESVMPAGFVNFATNKKVRRDQSGWVGKVDRRLVSGLWIISREQGTVGHRDSKC
jgi:hypothetical protein